MPDIIQSARDFSQPVRISSNVVGRINRMKRVAIYPDVVPTGKKLPEGREKWEVEADGLGNYEVDVTIPSQVQKMSNGPEKDAKVQAAVEDAVAPLMREDLGIYAN